MRSDEESSEAESSDSESSEEEGLRRCMLVMKVWDKSPPRGGGGKWVGVCHRPDKNNTCQPTTHTNIADIKERSCLPRLNSRWNPDRAALARQIISFDIPALLQEYFRTTGITHPLHKHQLVLPIPSKLKELIPTTNIEDESGLKLVYDFVGSGDSLRVSFRSGELRKHSFDETEKSFKKVFQPYSGNNSFGEVLYQVLTEQSRAEHGVLTEQGRISLGDQRIVDRSISLRWHPCVILVTSAKRKRSQASDDEEGGGPKPSGVRRK